ncbi:MAG: YiiD C-terminal domain-containing protein [bacterium]
MRSELWTLLLQRVPLTRTLGVEVEEASPSLVRLGFPLKPNLNRQKTAFGGSLYAAAVLAGWSLLWCVLKEKRLGDADIVIASSGERFVRPVSGRFVAECSAPRGTFDLGIKTLRHRGMARADLETEVLCDSKPCLYFKGTYGLIRKRTEKYPGNSNLIHPFDV